MLCAFTGDLVLQGIDSNPDYVFGDFVDYLNNENIKLCLNLESPFIDPGSLPIKKKITLFNSIKQVGHINYLSPFLINLSNNHINDYGNHSCKTTFKVLKENSHQFYGVGLSSDVNNIYIDSENLIIHLSFTTRSADFTGSKLFAEEDFLGPYSPDIKQLIQLKKAYNNYKIVVNIHWGIEDIKYPEPEKRKLAYKLIDNGADLIIGSHPHIIQPYEIYEGKLIFYSTGNFYFPDLEYEINGIQRRRKASKHQKEGIVPIFNFQNGFIELLDIIFVKRKQGKLVVQKERKLKLLKNYFLLYDMIFLIYYNLLKIKRLIKFIFFNPGRILKKIKKNLIN